MAGGIEFLVSVGALIALSFLPGILLAEIFLPGKSFDWFERLPLGLALSAGLFTPAIFVCKALMLTWDHLLLAWLGVILTLVAATITVVRWRRSARFADSRWARWFAHTPGAPPATQQPAQRVLAFAFLFALVAMAGLTQIGPNDEDDWNYFRDIRGMADTVRFTAPLLSDRNAVHPIWFFQAAIVRYLDVDLIRLGQNWVPAIFAPLSLLAFYALARALFQNQTGSLVAILLYFAFCIADLFNPDAITIWPGWWLIAHSNQDHTVVMLVFMPLVAALGLRYLRHGDARLLGALWLAAIGMIATHGLLGILLPAITFAPLILLRGWATRDPVERRRVLELLVAVGGLFVLLTPVIIALLNRTLPQLVATGWLKPEDVVFPLVRHRYTFFTPTIFTLRWDYLGQPAMLAALLLTPFLLGFVRRDLTAQFLFSTTLVVLIILYTPPIFQWLDLRMTSTIERLWTWIPKTFIIVYFVPHLERVVREGLPALRARVWNRAAQWTVAFGIGLALVLGSVPLYVQLQVPAVIGPGHALPNGAYAILKALRVHSPPSGGVVFAWRDITDAIPAYRATLKPVLYRENPKSAERADADTFLTSPFVTQTHLDILNDRHVDYVVLSGERELVAQMEQLPNHFQLLYRNEYGALFRVLRALRPDALIEANTAAQFGDWESAIQLYNQALADGVNDSLARTGLGMLLELAGKPRQAAREFEAALVAAPTNAQAHYHLARVYRTLGLNDQAALHETAAGALFQPAPKR